MSNPTDSYKPSLSLQAYKLCILAEAYAAEHADPNVLWHILDDLETAIQALKRVEKRGLDISDARRLAQAHVLALVGAARLAKGKDGGGGESEEPVR